MEKKLIKIFKEFTKLELDKKKNTNNLKNLLNQFSLQLKDNIIIHKAYDKIEWISFNIKDFNKKIYFPLFLFNSLNEKFKELNKPFKILNDLKNIHFVNHTTGFPEGKIENILSLSKNKEYEEKIDSRLLSLMQDIYKKEPISNILINKICNNEDLKKFYNRLSGAIQAFYEYKIDLSINSIEGILKEIINNERYSKIKELVEKVIKKGKNIIFNNIFLPLECLDDSTLLCFPYEVKKINLYIMIL